MKRSALQIAYAEDDRVPLILLTPLGMIWDTTQVELSIIHFLPKAKSISVAPLEPEDWDLIVTISHAQYDHSYMADSLPLRCYDVKQSLHAEYLESNLLFHVRTCSVGQVLEVWLKGKSRVSMRVGKSTEHPTSS